MAVPEAAGPSEYPLAEVACLELVHAVGSCPKTSVPNDPAEVMWSSVVLHCGWALSLVEILPAERCCQPN